MNKFCQECGKPLKGADKHCIECGHPIISGPQMKNRNIYKKKASKKQKLISSIAAALVILFAGFYMWGDSQVSAENIAKKFSRAVLENDATALQKVSIIHHGKFISKAEANALLALAKEDPEYIENNMRTMPQAQNSTGDSLFTVVENGKWLGIFKRYSVLVTPQYVRLVLPFDGVQSTFNGKEMPVKETKEDEVIYGPMAPGLYEVESSFSGEYTEVKTKEKIEAANEYSDWVTYDVELDANYVNLTMHAGGAPITKAYIKINDQKVPFDKDMKVERFGPLKLDGSTIVTPVVEMPWGEIESDKIPIENSSIEISPNTVNKKLSDTLSKIILSYGEEYVQAHAAWDASKFTTITGEMKDRFKDDFDYNRNNDELFSGKLEKVELDLDSLSYGEIQNGTRVEFPARFTFQADTYYRGDKAQLEKRIDACDIGLIFNKKDNSWKVNDCSAYWFGSTDITPTVALDGSKKIYNASAGAVAASASADTSDDISAVELESFMFDYNGMSVAALNTNDFSLVEDMIASNGPRLKEQRDYLDYVVSKGITEDLLLTELESFNKTGDNTWEVVTIEEFNIHKKDSSSKKKFRTKNIIKRIDGELKLYELIETKEI